MNILNKIFIDQRAVIENGVDLDLIDLAIYDYIKFSSNSKNVEKIMKDGDTYFYIDHMWIIEWLPLIKITTKAGIIKRIINLEREGLIIRHPECNRYKKTYYKFGDKYDSLECSTKVYNSIQTDRLLNNERIDSTLSERIGNNNNIENNNIDILKGEQKEIFEVISDIKTEFLKEFNRVKCSTIPTRVMDEKATRQLKILMKAGYSIADIGKALENAMKTRNHKESKFVYLTPEFITRPDKFNIYHGANFENTTTVRVNGDSDYEE
jgi:hypothetical protein